MEMPAEGTSSHAQRVLSLLNQQRNLGRFCDAMLSTASGQVHMAHCNILACFSNLFQEPSSTPCIQIDLPLDCPDDGLELLLNFFYTGELQLDDSNLEKIQNAASGLSIPAFLIPCQGLSAVETVQTPALNEDDTTKKTVFPLTSEEPELDCTPERKTRLRQKEKNNADESRLELASDNDHPASTSNTTTRSGRRVKGPNHLQNLENYVSSITRQGAGRKNTKEETNAIEESDPLKHQDMSEVEELQSSTYIQPEVSSLSEVDEFVYNPNDDNDIDNEEDSDREADIHLHVEETDEEYVPHDSPCSTTKSPRRKRKQNEKSTNKENGKRTPIDSKKENVQCPTCHKTFLSKYYLKVHNRRHTGEKPFKCDKCGKCYFRKENLLDHEAKNCLSRTEAVFSCPKCPVTFKKRRELRLHIVTHTGEMPNKCTSCPEQFMQKKDLRIHMIKVHGAPKPHACPLCPKCFLSRTELRLHEAAKHRGEKLFVCEECGHRASSRNGLKMHIKSIHRNERPFVCEICNHAFTQKANLNMHLRTHTGEKPFQCHLCGKTFRTQASLDKHNRTHTGERPFPCELCDQRFTEKGPLLRHISSKHQEGRPHLCQICNKSFKGIEQLRVHVQRHTGQRNFECSECGYKFTRQAHLRRHSQIHNRVQNYTPKQRRLRNLIVGEEGIASSSSPANQTAAPCDTVSLVVVEQVISASTEGPGSEQQTFTVNSEHGEFELTGRADGDVEETSFTVMEQTLLVTDAFPIQQATVVVEQLPGSEDDGK